MRRWLVALIALLVVFALTPALAADDGDATIIRDEYGVPHIFADTEADLFYSFGYI
jgi:acyl-homoserine lactone acylase PvdQ